MITNNNNQISWQIKIIALFCFLLAISLFFFALSNFFPFLEVVPAPFFIFLFVGLAFIIPAAHLIFPLGLAVLFVFVGAALLKGKKWAKRTMLVLSIIVIIFEIATFGLFYFAEKVAFTSSSLAKLIPLIEAIITLLVGTYLIWDLIQYKSDS